MNDSTQNIQDSSQSPLLFLHGLKGSPQGTKSVFLRKKFPDVIIPELIGDVTQRMEVVHDRIKKPSWLVGSSMGGLCALLFAMQKPKLVKGMVLLAPAVGLIDETNVPELDLQIARSTFIPQEIPAVVMAARQDQTIPLRSIQEMIQRSPDLDKIQLIEIDEDHSLNNSLEIMLSSLLRIMGRTLV